MQRRDAEGIRRRMLRQARGKEGGAKGRFMDVAREDNVEQTKRWRQLIRCGEAKKRKTNKNTNAASYFFFFISSFFFFTCFK